MDFIVENCNDIIGQISFENVPGSVVTDLLIAIGRGKKEDNVSSGTSKYNKMRVSTLRKMLHEEGMHVDGSMEAMIALLEGKHV